MQKYFYEGYSLGKAIKEPKFYSFPWLKTALYENGFKTELISKSLTFKPKLSASPAGNMQAIQIESGRLKTESDPRGNGQGSVFRTGMPK